MADLSGATNVAFSQGRKVDRNSSHIRLNQATHEWVIYAPSRRKRPQDFQCQDETLPLSSSKANCPFCKSDADWQDEILFELPDRYAGGWLTRVVSNKYPALSPAIEPKRSLSGIYLELPGYGHHEVIIEGPRHEDHPATLPLRFVVAIVQTYRQRYLELMEDRNNLFVTIFRNHGKRAGASLRHPHSQIIATPIVPRHRRWQEDEAQRYFDERGSCAYCDILAFEMSDRQRVIDENERFLAFVPYAAEVPFEIWILPKEHSSDFGTISDAEVVDFASILQDVLKKLYIKLKNPDYNYAIMTAARYKAGEPQLHWYCKIRPQLTTPAGFEMGSGIRINPSLPEADSAFLNEP